MGKKNLEQLFKDTFKGFQESPDDKVWKSIEATLDKKKKKKRVIPIWWQMGGVAALFAILFFAINPLDNSKETDNENQIEVVGTEDKKLPSSKDSTDNSIKVAKISNEASEVKNQDEISTEKYENEGNTTLANSEKVNQTRQNSQKQKQDNNTFSYKKKEAIAQTENTPSSTNKDLKSAIEQSIENTSTETEDLAIAQNKSKEKEQLDNPKKETTLQELSNQNTEVAQVEVEKKTEEEIVEKKSIYDAIAEKNTDEEEKELLAENTESKWSIGPSVAPVYFTGTGEGSPIHSNFNANSKSGNVNLSYGLTVSYDLGKKLKVRSGVHRVDYGYDTNEIVFSSSIQGSTNALIDNINYSETSRNLVVQSSKNVPSAEAANFSEFSSSRNAGLEGKMVQQLGYIEVPLELNYALIDKKIGVNIIGGVSSLFLVDNTVLLESEDLVTEVGEANNVNSVNFSTNVGVGLNYEISPKVQLNLEPVFKYQLNTFSETAGPFNPISVGVYSGVNFRF